MSVLCENVDYGSFLSLCSERSVVTTSLGTLSLVLVLSRKCSLWCSERKCIEMRVDVNAVGYKEEVEKFGHDGRDVNSRV